MGGSTFGDLGEGKTAREAFRSLVEQAKYDHGHAGYSGTIAEKNSFVEIPVPAGKEPVLFANELLDADDKRVVDKWGPAGCVKVRDGVWYFFGWASS